MAQIQNLIDAIQDSSVPSVGAAKLADWECEEGAEVPQLFRELLMRQNGGDLEPAFTIEFANPAFVDGVGAAHFARYFGVGRESYDSVTKLQQWFEATDRSVTSVPPDIYVIGDDWCGNVITFDSISGEIGFVDHETVGDDFADPETYFPIAGSFSELVDALKPSE